jgi:membrane-associated phospholipid phosphatase
VTAGAPAAAACAALLIGLAAGVARAAEPDQLVYDLRVDGAVTAGAAALWAGSELLKSHLAPADCRWCESNGLDDGVRSALRWTDRAHTAVTLSNAGAYLVAPSAAVGLTALAAGHEGRLREVGVDALLMAEATALAGSLDQLVKFTAGRQRPYAHAGLPNPDPRPGADDRNLSFYSAHATVTFALAASAGTIARLRGYRWAPWIWAAGAAIAASTAYLRIAADQHYFTDVVTGAAVGAGVGVAVPYFFHRGRTAGDGGVVTLAPAPGGGGGASLVYARAW